VRDVVRECEYGGLDDRGGVGLRERVAERARERERLGE
jgi:hypothetical protein